MPKMLVLLINSSLDEEVVGGVGQVIRRLTLRAYHIHCATHVDRREEKKIDIHLKSHTDSATIVGRGGARHSIQ